MCLYNGIKPIERKLASTNLHQYPIPTPHNVLNNSSGRSSFSLSRFGIIERTSKDTPQENFKRNSCKKGSCHSNDSAHRRKLHLHDFYLLGIILLFIPLFKVQLDSGLKFIDWANTLKEQHDIIFLILKFQSYNNQKTKSPSLAFLIK